MIILSRTLFSEIQKHGEEGYPYECCGAFFGRLDTAKDARYIEEIKRVENSWEDAKVKHRRFKITSQDYLHLEKYGKSQGLALLGFYHTHPDHPPIPSETDLMYAWPVFSYCILSVHKGVAKEMRSYVLLNEPTQSNLHMPNSKKRTIIIADESGKAFVKEEIDYHESAPLI